MKKGLLLVVLCLFVLGALHLGVTAVSAEAPKGVWRGGVFWGANARDFMPTTALARTFSRFYLYFFHDALLKPMPGNMFEPCLAESWNISPDYKVYTFKLRKGVKFQNGDEMTAEDCVWTFENYRGPVADRIKGNFQKLEAVNPYLFRVTFKEPFYDFLDYSLGGMATIFYIQPKKYTLEVGEAEYKKHPIGAGPYKMVQFKPGQMIAGEAHNDFWRKKPSTNRLEFYFVKNDATRYAMLMKGELDYVYSVKKEFYDKINSDPKLKDLRIVPMVSPTYQVIYPTAQFDPNSPWADPRVRKAASLALDRRKMGEIFFPGKDSAIGSLALEGDPEGAQFPPDPYDPERAKKLLAEAGYPNGLSGGKYTCTGGVSQYPYGEAMVNYWRAVGINMEYVPMDRPVYDANRRGGKLKGWAFTDIVNRPTIGMRLDFLLADMRGKYGSYPEIDALWGQYEKERDPSVKKTIIERIQHIMHDITMFLPVNASGSPQAVGPRTKGDPTKIKGPYPCHFPSPMEDIELNE